MSGPMHRSGDSRVNDHGVFLEGNNPSGQTLAVVVNGHHVGGIGFGLTEARAHARAPAEAPGRGESGPAACEPQGNDKGAGRHDGNYVPKTEWFEPTTSG